jgi:hypothetical protein
MAIEYVTDHVEQGLALPIDQYRNTVRFRGVLKSYLTAIQDAEDGVWSSILGRLLDNAIGAQLDAIGRIVGEERADREDDLYRIFLRARIRVNWSNGHANDVIAALRLINAGAFRYQDYYPASVDLHYDVAPTLAGIASPVLELAIAELAQQTVGAAIQASVIAGSVIDGGALFSYDEAVAGSSFSYAEGEAGGFLAGVYEA